MRPCPDREELLLARASGTLTAEETKSLEAHLATCEGCRGELGSLEATLAAVRLPPAGAREQRLQTALPTRVAAAIAPRRRGLGWRVGLGAALAAAAACALWLAVPRLASGRRAHERTPIALVEASPGTEGSSTLDSEDDAVALEEWAGSADPVADELAHAFQEP